MFYASGLIKNLPLTLEFDEGDFLASAQHVLQSGNLDPGRLNHPGSTIVYPLSLFLLVTGGRHSQDIVLGALLGRWINLAYGVLVVALTVRLGAAIFNWKVGLIAGLVMAVSPLFGNYAAHLRTDMVKPLFILLSVAFLYRLSRSRQDLSEAVGSGLMMGLAVSSHYQSALLLPAMGVGIAWLLFRKGASKLIIFIALTLFGIATLVSFAVSTPFFWLDTERALSQLRMEARSQHLGADGLNPLQNLLWYVYHSLPLAISVPGVVFLGVGVLFAVRQRDAMRMVLLVCLISYFVLVSLHPLHWRRWALTVLPLAAMFAASGLIATYQSLHSRLTYKRFSFAGLLAVVMIAPIVLDGALSAYARAFHSTRRSAGEWINQRLPAGSKIAHENYGPLLDQSRFITRQVGSLASQKVRDKLMDEGFEYGVFSSAIYLRYFNEPGRYLNQVQTYQQLFQELEVIATFVPFKRCSVEVMEMMASCGGPELVLVRLPQRSGSHE